MRKANHKLILLKAWYPTEYKYSVISLKFILGTHTVTSAILTQERIQHKSEWFPIS